MGFEIVESLSRELIVSKHNLGDLCRLRNVRLESRFRSGLAVNALTRRNQPACGLRLISLPRFK